MNPTTMARASLIALTLLAVTLASNPASAQSPKKGPPPPPDDPIVRIEAALDKLDKRLEKVEGDVATLKTDVADLKKAKAKTDATTDKLASRVTKTEIKTKELDRRTTTLERRPPLTIREYRTVYKVADPPTYIYVRTPGSLTRLCYTYVDGRLYLYESSDWILVTR